MITVNWKTALEFEAETETGHHVTLDAYPEDGQTSKGPTPVEMLLASMAACSAIDVVMIMQKKRQVVTSYRVEVEGERGPQGVYPRPFLSFKVRHIIDGENIDPAAFERAVQLSDEKYCTVMTTLRSAPEIRTEWQIEGQESVPLA